MADPSPYSGQEEDRIDRWFNRKLAYPVAVACARMGMHPNAVSILGCLLGVSAGWFFQYQALDQVVWGVVLLVICTIVDNADGMVARMTGKSSDFGYVLDGICDNFVFISIYLCSMYGAFHLETPFGGTWGWWVIPLGVVAGVSHSRQSSMLDFYKHQWKYFACLSDGARFKSPAEVEAERENASGMDATILGVRLAHSKQQVKFTRARQSVLPLFEGRRTEPGFADRYAALNWLPMKGWFFLGPNWHVIAVCTFGLLGRMDWFLISQIVPFNLVLIATLRLQASRDRALAQPAS